MSTRRLTRTVSTAADKTLLFKGGSSIREAPERCAICSPLISTAMGAEAFRIGCGHLCTRTPISYSRTGRCLCSNPCQKPPSRTIRITGRPSVPLTIQRKLLANALGRKTTLRTEDFYESDISCDVHGGNLTGKRSLWTVVPAGRRKEWADDSHIQYLDDRQLQRQSDTNQSAAS